MLNSPAGRCLLLLIDRAGSIVTQQEFLDIVWQSRGMLVSSNTYYQNISILRKRAPKRLVLKLTQSLPFPDWVGAGKRYANNRQRVFACRGSTRRGTVCGGADDRGVNASSAPAAPVIGKHTRWLAVVLGLLIILAGAAVTGYMSARENRFVEDYRFAASVGACRVYLADDIQTHGTTRWLWSNLRLNACNTPGFTSAGTLCSLVRRSFAATGQ